MPAIEAVIEAVRERVTPSDAERARLDAAVDEAMTRTENAIRELPVEADAVLVGSTARDTWLATDRDIDVFVRFSPSVPRSDLEEYGLSVGHKVLPSGREEYAEHPYVTGELDGYDVDLVPCYDVADPGDIESAVDRTPFHTEYVARELPDDRTDDVRVLKQFTKAIGTYGSDLRTRGFSGYLLELLVLEYGSFRAIVDAASEWQPPHRHDPADHGERTFDDALVVIDPTDPTRNVAAVLSRENLARFQHYARDLRANPRLEAFEPDSPEPIDAAAVEAAVTRRGTTPIALVFETPDLVDDELYPQLRKSRRGIQRALENNGFEPLRVGIFARERTVLLYELEVPTRPVIERHEGPPVHVRSHAETFYEKYAGEDVAGPFIEGERYVVERERSCPRAEDLLETASIFETRLAPGVEEALRAGREVLVGHEIATLAAEFGDELAAYFDPDP